MEKILLIGAGALACDFIDLFGKDKFVAAYVDAQFAQADTIDGVRIYTNWQQAVRLASHYILAVSSIDHRERMRVLAADAGLEPSSPLVFPTALISKRASLARGSVVTHLSSVGPAARLGLHCLIMHGVVIGHDSVIEDNVVVCSGVCIGGNVIMGTRSFVGMNAVLAPKISVGSDSFIAAGAACLRDVPPNSLLIGNPAKRTINT